MSQLLKIINDYEVLSPVTTTFWNLAYPYICIGLVLISLIFLGIFTNTVLLIILCKKSIELQQWQTTQKGELSVGDFG